MGNIRTPKPHYFDGGVVEFYVKNKLIYYKTIIWTRDGTKQFTFEDKRYSSITDPKVLVSKALQSFSSVGVIEN